MKEIIVYCYNRCSTCKKAIGYLKEDRFTLEVQHLKSP